MPESSGGGTGNPILDITIVLTLILVGGFFAASEIALITVKRHRLNQLIGEGSRAARVAQHLTEDPSRFLATIQIALTFLGFLASAFGAVSLSGSLAHLVRLVPLSFVRGAANEISFVIVTLLIALAAIIVGELVPKTLALTFADRFAIFVARPIGWFDRALRPIVWFVSTVSNVLVRALGGKDRPQAGYLSTEELKMLVETGSEQGGIEEDEKEMIHGVIELAETKVHQVMVPRIGIRAVEVSDPVDEVLEMIVKAGHSRVPVYQENLDNIVGILYAKDLLPYLMPGAAPASQIDIRAIARPATYVPETKPVDEQIVGEIQDEYDSEESLVEALEDNANIAYRLDGRVSMDDLRDLFELPDTEEEDEDEYDTVGGFIVHRVGRIPLPGAVVQFRDVTLRVEAAEPRRIAKVIATRPRQAAEADDDVAVIEAD